MLKFLCKRDVLPRCTYGIKVSLYSTNQIPNPIQREYFVVDGEKEIPKYERNKIVSEGSEAKLMYKSNGGEAAKLLTQAMRLVKNGTLVSRIQELLLSSFPPCVRSPHLLVSVNEVAYGGPPSTYELALGDIVKIEVAYTQDPNIGGLVRTSASSIVTDHSTDSPHPHILRLNSLAREALYKGIGGIRLGCQFALIPDIIHQYVDSNLDHFGPKYSLLGGVPTSLLILQNMKSMGFAPLLGDTLFVYVLASVKYSHSERAKNLPLFGKQPLIAKLFIYSYISL